MPRGCKRSSILVEKIPTKRCKTSLPSKSDDCDADRCHIVIKTLSEADHLPLSVREMLVSAVPTSLMVHKDLRVRCQERVVEMMCEVFQEIEASLQQLLCEKEVAVEILKGAEVERQAASTKAEIALKAACETLCQHTDKFKKDTGSLKKAHEDLARAKDSLNAISAKMTKVEEGRTRITDVVVESFTPLKNGSAESQSDVKQLLRTVLSIGKDFEFEQSLMAIMPAALTTTLEKRSSFESLVLQQFENGMSERLAKYDEEIASLTSAKAEEMEAVNNASAFMSTAKDAYELSLAALKQAQANHRDVQATHEAAFLAVKSWLHEHDVALVDCESSRRDLTAFRDGALATFYELNRRVAQKPISDDSCSEGSALVQMRAAEELQTGLTESTEVQKPDTDMKGSDETAVCQQIDVAQQVEADKPEEPLFRSASFSAGANEKIRNLECMPSFSPERSVGALAGA